MTLAKTTITGTFEDGASTPLSGTVTFTPSETVYSSGAAILSADVPVQAKVTAGHLTDAAGNPLQLVATDNAGMVTESLTGFWYWTVTVNITGVPEEPWSFFLPSSPATTDLYALANTAGASGGGGSGTVASVAVVAANGFAGTVSNPTTTPQVTLETTVTGLLKGTGTGLSAATADDVPGFDGVTVTGTPTAGQVPTATSGSAATWQPAGGGVQSLTFTYGSSGAVPSSGTFTKGQVVVDQNGIPRVCTTAGTPGAWRRLAAFGWQFFPEDYGCAGDGQVVGDAVVTGGALGTVTSATAAFTSAVTGKTFVLNGGQASTAALIGTLTYVNATTCTMSVPAGQAMTGAVLFWSSDNGPGLQDMAVAMRTYAVANGYRAQGILTGIYGAATLYQATAGPGNYNTHLPVLAPAADGTTRQLKIDLIGPGRNGDCDYFKSVVPNITPGSIVSMVNAPGTPDATFGQQSVIGGPTGNAAFTGSFANVHVTTQGIAVYAPAYPSQIGLDFAYCAGWSWQECSAKTLQAPASNSPAYPDMPGSSGFQNNSIGIGFRAPLVGNNDAVTGSRLAVEGYRTNGWIADHFTCDGLATIYQHISLIIDLTHSTSGNSHGVTIKNWSCEQYNGGLNCNGGGSGFCFIDITMDTETIGNADPAYDVSDNGNLRGVIRITDAGARTSRTPVISNGAPNLKVINDMIGPGHMASPPAVPASGTPLTNVKRDASIKLTTGAGVTVSAISIDGTSLGLTMAASSTLVIPMVLLFGKAITLTYTGGTPTWDWWLS